MSRPADWWVLELPGDPTPGDPGASRALARSAGRMADDAGDAHRAVRGLAGDGAALTWLGAAGEVFRGALDDFPRMLRALQDSYEQAADALRWWAGRLEELQATADRALAQGRQARAEVDALQGRLAMARTAASGAGAASARLAQLPAGVPPPDPAEVRAAVRSADAAASRVSALGAELSGAQARLSAARSIAEQARELRQSDARTAARRLHEASDAGIAPRSRWERFREAAVAAWRITVTVATVVAVVVAVVALFVGGPLVWGLLLAASAVLLADSLHRYGRGEAPAWEVGLNLLGVVPGGRLLTAAGRVTGLTAAGARGAGAVGRPLAAAGTAMRAAAAALRSGASDALGRGGAAVLGRGDDLFLGGRYAERWMDVRTGVHRLTGGRVNEHGDLVLQRWDPVRTTADDHPLDAYLRETFRTGTYDEVMARYPRPMHRSITAEGNPTGAWWAHEAPTGPLQTQLDFAIKPEWTSATSGGVTHALPAATHRVETVVPPGGRYFEGAAAPQASTGLGGRNDVIPGSLIGGGTQVVLPDVAARGWPVTRPVPVTPP